MKNRNYIHRKTTLSKKIGVTNGIIICVTFSILVVAFEIVHGNMVTEKEKQMMETYLNNSLNIVDDKLKDMGRVSLVCFSDEQVQEILRNYDEYSYLEQLQSDQYLHQFYTSLISIRDDIKGVYIFNKEDLIFFQDSVASSFKTDFPIEEYIKKLQNISQKDGEVSGCHLQVNEALEFMHYMMGGTNEKYFYLIRQIKSFSPYKTVGYIVLTTPERTFRTLLEKNLEDTMFFALSTEDGKIVSSEKGNELKQNMEVIGKTLKNEGEDGNFWIDIEDKKYLISCKTSSYSGMKLIVGKSISDIYGEVMQLTVFALVFFSVMSIVALWITVHSTRKRLEPLEELSRTMYNFETKNMDFRFTVEGLDETGKLKQSFNQMLDIISNLIEEEYKSKERLQEAQLQQQKSSMLYLKNQINPHFLYNTLDTIRIRAELNGDKEVGYMILQLVEFFRLNVKADKQFVTIAHEVKLIQAYMNLMCYRYDKLQFNMEVDKDLSEIRIPNFLLQPLVENGLMHGLRNLSYRGEIRLSIRRLQKDRDYIRIQIYDNGVGLSEESRKLLKNMLENYQSDYWREQEETHIGVLNVQKRLKMYYPEECGLTYRENEEGGVTAEILIKTKTNEEWEDCIYDFKP